MTTPVIVMPIWWSHHSYSVFGVRPQEVLNEQLVDVADFGFAMFANRPGSPTGAAESGTVEEVERLLAANKHVSLVRNMGYSGPAPHLEHQDPPRRPIVPEQGDQARDGS